MGYNAGTNVFIGPFDYRQRECANHRFRSLAGSDLTINYKNPDGSTGSVTTTGADTVGALVAAINASNRGLTATFTTGAAAGDGRRGHRHRH